MKRFGKKHQKRVAKLVAAALMCASGGLFSPPSVASAEEASEVTVTNVSGTSAPYAVSFTPAGGMTGWPNSPPLLLPFMYYPTSANVLNITGAFDVINNNIRFCGGFNDGATNKTVNINGTNIGASQVIGGYAPTGYSVTENHVNILGGTTTVQYISGGEVADGAKVSYNHVKIFEGSTVKYGDGSYGATISGGVGNGDVDANTVTISGTLTSADTSDQNYLHVVGGETYGDGKNATGNSVTISGATFNTGAIDDLQIKGGWAKNAVDEITGDTMTHSGNATDNNVAISGASTFGEGTWKIYGGYSENGNATDNTVTISGTANVAGDVYGGMATKGNAGGTTADEGNKVTIEGGTVTGNVYGGGSTSGAATYNTADISGGAVGTEGKSFGIYGGQSTDGEASHNKVSIKDATINDHIYGATGNTAANYNEVTISGTTTFGKDDMGKYFLVHGGVGAEANNNIVNILSKVTVGGIIGCEAWGENVVPTGNTLNLGATGIEVKATESTYADVTAFQTIALTENVAFAKGAKVIHANSFKNADYSIFTGTLDITKVNFTGTGTMTLLASGTAFDSLSLKYLKDGKTETTGTLNTTTPITVKSSGGGGGTETLSNKVVLTTTGGTTHKVSLDETNNFKNVLYKIEGDGDATVTRVALSKWDGTEATLTGYTASDSLNIDTSDMKNDLTATTAILTTKTPKYFDGASISGGNEYKPYQSTPSTEAMVTFTGSQSKGVTVVNGDNSSALVYKVGAMDVQGISLGEKDKPMTWGTGRAATTAYNFAGVSSIDASKLQFEFQKEDDKAALHKGSTMTLVSDATGLTAGATVTGKPTQTVDYKVNGAALTGTLTGTVSTTAGAVNYQADSMTLDSVKLAGWDGTEGAVPTGWTANASGVGVDTDGMNMKTLPTATANILTTKTANYFTKDKITGENQYKETTSTEGDKDGAVTLTVTQTRGVTTNADSSALVYEAGKTKQVTDLALGTVAFVAGTTPLYTASDDAYAYKGANVNTDKLDVTFPAPLTVAAEDSMTLLAANATLADIAEQTKTSSYTASVTEAPGLTLSGDITGKLAKADDTVTYDVTENKANTLTFGEMDWADGATLMDHDAILTNVSFDGAKVDTSAIKFKDLEELKDGDKTLIANYGGQPGEITGETYEIGVGMVGMGKAAMEGDNLIFTATSEAALDEEMAHNALIGAEASMATLATGNDFIGSATEGLALSSNTGADGVSAYAQLGGGKMRQETGSHVDVNTWNAIIALGHKNEKEKSTTEERDESQGDSSRITDSKSLRSKESVIYGAFFEYGKGNYTTHNGGERGDGSMHYTGGGLLAKWKQAGGLYVEGSLRAGSVHDDARNILRAAGVPYSYDKSAGYWGAHIGIGKEFEVSGGNAVDVYAKYFYNRRNGISFDTGGADYNLDAVTSSVLRIGARYTMKRESWNFYGGLAYEHELDGKSAGKVTMGTVETAIRAADIGGGSARLELGATMTPEKSPWSLDLNLTGFAGKKKGLMGGVSASFLF